MGAAGSSQVVSIRDIFMRVFALSRALLWQHSRQDSRGKRVFPEAPLLSSYGERPPDFVLTRNYEATASFLGSLFILKLKPQSSIESVEACLCRQMAKLIKDLRDSGAPSSAIVNLTCYGALSCGRSITFMRLSMVTAVPSKRRHDRKTAPFTPLMSLSKTMPLFSPALTGELESAAENEGWGVATAFNSGLLYFLRILSAP